MTLTRSVLILTWTAELDVRVQLFSVFDSDPFLYFSLIGVKEWYLILRSGKNPNTAGRDQSPPSQTHKHTDYRWMLWARGWEVGTAERSWSWRDLYVWNTPFKWCLNLFFPLQCVWCNWNLSAWLRSPCCIIAAKLKRLTGHHFDSKAVFATTDHEMDPLKRLQSN